MIRLSPNFVPKVFFDRITFEVFSFTNVSSSLETRQSYRKYVCIFVRFALIELYALYNRNRTTVLDRVRLHSR